MKNKHRLLPLLALLSAFPPLSTDMYLAAMPLLQETWGQPERIINLTLVGFFVSYCLFLLIYGPLSDRFGRRPPLLAGIGLFVAASLLCATAQGVTSLILFRVLQAAGAASASALALAISKDVFTGRERERILAWIGVIMALAPMLAPVLGSFVMTWASWRWIFVIQGAVGAVGWVGVLRMEETLKQPTRTGVFQTAEIYIALLRNPRYLGLTLLMSVLVLPHFAFIGGSAHIYITDLGLSERTFGYFFAFNALACMGGSFTFTRLQRGVDSTKILTVTFLVIILGGAGLLVRWIPGPWGLALPMAVASFAFGLSRPPSNNLILEQVDRHAGAASSLLIFIFFLMGAFAMWLIALDWSDRIRILGVLVQAVV